MLVFGGSSRREVPGDKLAAIRTKLAAADASRPGIVRHGLIADALVEAGELAQGVIDAEFLERGEMDARSPAGEATMALAGRVAGHLARSWAARSTGSTPALAALADVSWPALPDSVETRTPEGFAFYAVYPEAYLASAGRLGSRGPARVIGLRSVGTTLAAAVAAGLGAPPPITARPVGHPFDRRLSLSSDLSAEIAAARTGVFAIVDEGPGLSGSSFAATVRALASLGVEADRIHLLPSHSNEPGAEATPATRAVWRRVRRHVTTFDDLVLHARTPAHRLETWFRDLTGEPVAPLEDLSGGLWRGVVGLPEPDWPPAQTWLERRKFRLRSESGDWLLKFAGLGETGRRKLDRARALAEAGFCPQPAGWRHGFLAQRWLAARPLASGASGVDRARLVARIGAYLGFRARAFPAPEHRGASLEALAAMARHNTGAALGDAAAACLGWTGPLAGRLQRHVRPVEVDGRLHAWEWLCGPGEIIKTDALDHHAAHDLVGCQDVAWDVAGAIVEFALGRADAESLAATVEGASGRSIHPELVRFLLPCYAAFQLGAWTMTTAGTSEASRAGPSLGRYRRWLSRACEGPLTRL